MAVQPGYGQYAVHQLLHPHGFRQNHSGCLGMVREHIALNSLGITADGHKRGPKLMGCILEKGQLFLFGPVQLCRHAVHCIL